ncbi:MAG: hypothetical protein AB1705_07155 [Verrucomicrobiota bacterium]
MQEQVSDHNSDWISARTRPVFLPEVPLMASFFIVLLAIPVCLWVREFEESRLLLSSRRSFPLFSRPPPAS